ncbi:hypothetical protein [Thermoflexibacter ruber]|uniref:Uncharacterized protein n=1 Tax=Thermoflexibacter ruber TaxID=1003 RepID=A0A1I2GBZ2_9BACT|nr:hypothetical protein [Thermoflexibacter ruber]SFF14649.1 hypothetical protein SAMN04488541_101780 [Thermoflexibacter ruber]
MNENELKNLWKSANAKITESLVLNRQHIEEITKIKAQSLISSIKPIKVFTILVGITWVISLGGYLANLWINQYTTTNKFFLFAATAQVFLTALTIGFYVYQLILLNNIDFSNTVVEIQEKIIALKTSTIHVARLCFLQLPLWTIFYWNDTMFKPEYWAWWLLQGIFTIGFTVLSIWLFFNLKYENRKAKWFLWLFCGKEWQPLVQAMEMLENINEFTKE